MNIYLSVTLRLSLILVLVLNSSLIIIAQDGQFTKIRDASPKLYKQYKKARQLAHQKKLGKAYKLFDKITKKCPTCFEPFLKMGTIHYQRYEYDQATVLFKKALDLNPDFNPKLYYTIGLAYWKSKDYSEALDAFSTYIKKGQKNSPLMAKAQKKYIQSKFALSHPANNDFGTPTLLNEYINTDKNESFPMITADANTLVYTARLNRREYLFESIRKDNKWMKPQQLDIDSNQIESGAHSISADGKTIIFTSCSKITGYGSCDLWESKKEGDKWSTPRNLGSQINTTAWEGHPALGNNGQVLYFSSNRIGSLGKKDLWVSYKNEHGLWSKPNNLGPTINTKDNEQAPYIHPDNLTLYFASDGHRGMGDLDLFISRKTSLEQWAKPMNLGQPINTRVQEGCISISLDGTEGFLVSDRKYEQRVLQGNNEGAEINIYRFDVHKDIAPLPVTYVQAWIVNEEGQQLTNVDISLYNLNEMKTFYRGKTDKEGQVLLILPAEQSFAFKVEKESYLFHSENFNPSVDNGISNPYEMKITLYKVPVKDTDNKAKENNIVIAPIILKNVFFESGKYDLAYSSYYELDQLVNLLEKNESLNIQINGHTDNVGDADKNKILSNHRAKAVYNYLVQKGIKKDRLKYQGFGEEQPIDSNDSQKGRRNNRRTEFVVDA